MGVFDQKIIWITGAGSGIGESTALMFAREGAHVFLFGRRAKKLEGVAGEIEKMGGRGTPVPFSVTDRKQVDAVTKELLNGQSPSVDVLVNNAGVNFSNRHLNNMQPEEWDAVINTNLTGTYNVVRAALPAMRRQGGGLIINVSSIWGTVVSHTAGAAYIASKHGLNGLSHTINEEEWEHGIRSVALCPGTVNTPLLNTRAVPLEEKVLQQMLQPEDIAETIRFLALMPHRMNIPEIQIMPTMKRASSMAK